MSDAVEKANGEMKAIRESADEKHRMDMSRERCAKEAGLDPLMERSYRRLLTDLPKRVLTMLSKLFGVKGVFLIGTGFLTMQGTFGNYAWLAWILAGIVVVMPKAAEKIITLAVRKQ